MNGGWAVTVKYRPWDVAMNGFNVNADGVRGGGHGHMGGGMGDRKC